MNRLHLQCESAGTMGSAHQLSQTKSPKSIILIRWWWVKREIKPAVSRFESYDLNMRNKILEWWMSHPHKQIQPCSDFIARQFYKERILGVAGVRGIFESEEWEILAEVSLFL